MSPFRLQHSALAFLMIVVLVMTGILSYSNGVIFRRFLGSVNPMAAIGMSTIVGFWALSFLQAKGWFRIGTGRQLRLRYALVAVLSASISILIDLEIVFPEDMNIQFPQSLLFYPVIGFFVEIVFHILPLTGLFFFVTAIFKTYDAEKVAWFCIPMVAMLEPTYQALYLQANPTWVIVSVWVNLFFFNTVQLLIFKRYDFISMYLFRLIFYVIWHIVWGYFRLELLF
ncbi:MAG: hypothetical protein OEV74_03475 [Cyclobacteriaceae bacterium]|nr:hypothetical protein [Cyclobacteriaceae bacterium]MDH4295316.1 hypothetical protein [Cyclobacteriaceae bacterium]MDH5248261.1 hypothetical protein [Cyclobacteriaceae bacterium]